MKKRYSGHYCRICGSIKPHEAYSGKGHKTHICKSCSCLPKSERDEADHENEIFGFLGQTNISARNISRLRELTESGNERISYLARVVLEVAEVKPGKQRRLKELARKRPDLLAKLNETGLIVAHHI